MRRREPNPVPHQQEQLLDEISDDWVIVDHPLDEGREHHIIHAGTPVDQPGGGLTEGRLPSHTPSQPQPIFPCGLQQNLKESSSTPCGSRHYSFVASQKPTLPEAFSNQVKAVVTEIKQRYESLMEKRETVRASLSEFRKALQQPETTDISTCFYVIKNAVGKGVKIDIVQGENPHVRVDDEVFSALPEEYQRAIKHFNVVLINCHGFLEGEQEVIKFIDDQLTQIRREQHINAQADVDTCREVENLPEEIRKAAAELKCFLHDVEVAKSRFEDPRTTGLQLVLPTEKI